MKTLLSLILLSTFTFAFSQEKDTVAMKYGNTITKEDLSKHLHVIASDEYGGRETGKKSLNMAAEYISNFYKSIGIKPYKENTYYQTYKVALQSPDGINITMGEKSFEFKKDFYLFPSYLKKEIITANVIFIGYGIDSEKYNDYKNVDVKGKIVIVLDGEPKNKKGNYYVSGTSKKSDWSNWRMGLKAKTAKEKGAIAVFTVDENASETIKSFGHFLESDKMRVLTDDIEFDYLKLYISTSFAEALIGKPLDKITDKINAKGKPITIESETKLKIDIDKKTEINNADNVLAYVEGSDKKEELIVVSAHYDHIGIQDGKVYNGADDDGSGTVAVMEMAEAFIKAKQDGHGPRRSILFLNVSGEEKGLLGSKYYSENPVFPLENTVADLNIDMIGRLDKDHADNENYVYIIGSNMLSTQLHNINENANATYSDLELDYTYNDKDDPNRYYYRSDHYNFAKNNIPVIFYFNGVHADYHKHTDTVDKIIFSKMEKITRLVFYTAWELVNREERIKLNEITE